MSGQFHLHDLPLALEFRYPHLPQVIHPQHELVQEIALTISRVSDRAALTEWMCGPLARLIPHEKAVAGFGVMSFDSHRIDGTVAAGMSTDYFARYVPRDESRRSPLFERWITKREPQDFVTKYETECAHLHWSRNAGRCGIDNGVMDAYEQGTTGRFSFLKLFNLEQDLTAAKRLLHYAVTPHLNEMWQRISRTDLGKVEAQPRADLMALLSAAETEVCKWLLNGKTSWEISRILQKSEQTVRNQSSSIYRKLAVASRVELLAVVARNQQA